MKLRIFVLLFVLTSLSLMSGIRGEEPELVTRVGFAQKDITPQVRTPMWGYGARKDILSDGILDPLMAKAIVLEVGSERLALVGLDLGRAPTGPMMEEIRKQVKEKAGVGHVMLVASHTHHGPVLELLDREGFGKGRFDDTLKYLKELPVMLSETIIEAASKLVPAKLGVDTADVTYNRNRHTKREPKPRDPSLNVIRFDDLNGKPLAIMVNFTGHPVMTNARILKFSADYPGFMMNHVEKEMGAPCVFMQGASGDMSVNGDGKGPKEFGAMLGDKVVELTKGITTEVPERPSIQAKDDTFHYGMRVKLSDPAVIFLYSQAFFPELIRSFSEDYKDGMHPELCTVLLNREIALVGGSGEFFCNHANRLRERAYVKHTLFLGYCNGYHNYFPTIEAVSEGGYGADATVSLVAIGAGEEMMNKALINLYSMLGKMTVSEKD